jgi:hypothetical protein
MPNLANHLRLIPRGLDPVAANCGSDGFVFSFGAYIEAAGILLGPDFNHRNSALDHRSPDLGLAAIRGTAVGAALGALIATGFSSHWFVYGAGIPLCGIISTMLRLATAYRFAAITLSIVLLVAHAESLPLFGNCQLRKQQLNHNKLDPSGYLTHLTRGDLIYSREDIGNAE